MGYGRHHAGSERHGSEWQDGGYGCPGYGGYMMGNLSDEDIQKWMISARHSLNPQKNLRQNIYQKSLALESEFAKKNPDAKNAANLQKKSLIL